MRKYFYLILAILLASVLAAGCTSNDGSGVQEVKAQESIPSTESNAAQEQTTSPVKGSFKNPASIGETIVLAAPGGTYEVSAADVKRSNEANYLIKSANEFNSEPADGYEYLLVKARVTLTEGDDPVSLGSSDFKIFCNGVEYKDTWEVLPNDYIEFSSGQIMPGATKEGWLQYTVPTGQEAVLSFQPNMFDESTAYISLGN